MKTVRPWYMRKIVLSVLCMLAIGIPNLLNYCEVEGFSNQSGYYVFGCFDSLFYAFGIEWQNMFFISLVCFFIAIVIYSPIEIYYWIIKDEVSTSENTK